MDLDAGVWTIHAARIWAKRTAMFFDPMYYIFILPRLAARG